MGDKRTAGAVQVSDEVIISEKERESKGKVQEMNNRGQCA